MCGASEADAGAVEGRPECDGSGAGESQGNLWGTGGGIRLLSGENRLCLACGVDSDF